MLTGFIEILQSKKLGERVQIFSLNMIGLLRWVLVPETAAPHQVVAMPKTKMVSGGAQKAATTLAATKCPFLAEAGTGQACQVLKKFTVVYIYAASDACVPQ